jgi:hypothetical protein
MCAVAVATGILLAPAGSSFANAQTVRGELQEHPRIMQAIRDIEDAIANMEAAPNYFGGHKAAAVAASREAVRQLRCWGGSARTWRAVISHLSGEFRCVLMTNAAGERQTRHRTVTRYATFPMLQRESFRPSTLIAMY